MERYRSKLVPCSIANQFFEAQMVSGKAASNYELLVTKLYIHKTVPHCIYDTLVYGGTSQKFVHTPGFHMVPKNASPWVSMLAVFIIITSNLLILVHIFV